MELHIHLKNKQPLLCSPPLTSYPTSDSRIYIQGYKLSELNFGGAKCKPQSVFQPPSTTPQHLKTKGREKIF